MERSARMSRPLVAVVAVALAFGATAQSLNTPPANPAPTLKAPAPPPARSPTPISQGRPSSIPSDSSQRLNAPAAIPETGPAPTSSKSAVPQNTPVNPPVRALDGSGKPIPGAVRVGPNRILDPSTGKVHTTMPMGGGERTVD